MANQEWDWEDLAKLKRGAKYEMDIDIQRLEEAVSMIRKVEETLSEAFWNKALKSKDVIKLDMTGASAAMRLSRAMLEVKLVADALKEVKKRIY